MIEGIFGLNGSGKGLFTMKMIYNLLTQTDHVIITNFAIRFSTLAKLLKERCPDKEIDLDLRIRMLFDDEPQTFWKYLPYGYEVEVPTKEDQARGKRPDFTKCVRVDKSYPLDEALYPDVIDAVKLPPVVHIIDEAYNFFDSRSWQETGKVLLWYTKQHRKFNSDIIFASPEFGDLDAKIRGVIKKHHYMRNLGEEQLWGMKKPQVFSRLTYNGVPRPGVSPEKAPVFKLDKGLADCYDTAAGVGIMGRVGADSTRKRKGLPWQLCIVALFVVFFLVWNSGNWFGWGFKKLIGSSEKPKIDSHFKSNSIVETRLENWRKMTNYLSHHESVPARAPLRSDSVSNIVTNDQPKIFLCGISKTGNDLRVYLSDGSVYGPRDIEALLPNGVRIRGVWYKSLSPTQIRAYNDQLPAQLSLPGIQSKAVVVSGLARRRVLSEQSGF